MAKAKLTTRGISSSTVTSDNLAKGSQLTHNQLDSNFINLRDQTFGIAADDSATIQVGAGDTLYIQGGSNVTTSTDSAGVLTINSTGEVTASSTTTFTNKTFDVEATGNSISNIDVADLKSGVLDTDLSSVSGSDDTLASAKAIKAYVDTQDAATGIGDLTAIGSTLISPSNANLTLDPSGTGTIELNANTNVTGNLTASGSLNTDGIEIQDNNIKASRTNDDLILQTNNTGIVALESNVRVGEDRASGVASATITGGAGQNLSLIGGNADAGEVKVMAGPANSSGETGEIFLKPGAAAGVVHVGSGSGNATITSNGAHNLTLRTNDGGTEPYISLQDGANGNIEVTPHQGGTGLVEIGNASTVSTGDSGGGTVKAGGIFFRNPGGNANAGRTNFNAIEIPFNPDGSTSSDMTIGLDSNADPFITFNTASTDAGAGAKIKTNTGNLILQSGSQRIELAANTVKLGNNSIVVEGNKISTDVSNEDIDLDPNGTGNVSSRAQLDMNSNKIVNVTDPASAQDAATKAYVDANSGSTGDLSFIGSTISSPSNADLTLTTSGTGDIVLEDLVYSSGTATVNSATHNFGKFTLNPPSANAGDILQLHAGTKSYDNNNGTGSKIDLRYKNRNGATPEHGVYIYNENAATSHAVIGTAADADCLDLMIVSNGPASNNADINFTTTSLTGSTRNIDINLNPGNPTGPAPGRVKLYDGEYAMPYPDGSNGQVISTNGSGTLSFTTPFKVVADDSAAVDILSGGTLYIQGGTNVTTATDSAGVVTINATGDVTGSSTTTFTNKTFDAEGTGNSISNIDVANLKSGVLDTNISSVSGSDDTLASAKAIKTYVDSQISGVGSASTGDITFVGSTMISPSNADITLNPAGTGKVNINAVYTLPNADGSANQVLGTNGSGVLSFRDPTAINIDGGVADSTYTSVPTIDGGTA